MKPSVDAQKRLVLIGAGSAVFTRGLLADLISAVDLGAWTVRLVDTNDEALEVARRLALRMVREQARESEIAIEASTSLRSMLEDADFVVCCVGVGGRDAWKADWEVAERYGVLQPVGDSVLPGGISRAMRTIPVMVGIARDVSELAPGAMFFNYSNPMTSNCRVMTQGPHVGVVGLCHGVLHSLQRLARFIDKPSDDVTAMFGGINHLTFIYQLRWRGRDAWPLVRDRLAAQRSGPLDEAKLGIARDDGTSASSNPFCWELFDRTGAYPAPGDRHVTEFFPERFGGGDYYGRRLGIDAFSIEQRLEAGDSDFERMRREGLSENPIDQQIFRRSTGEQEQLVPILRSVLLDQHLLISANVPNHALVPGIPEGSVVEVPAIVTAAGVRAIALPDFPPLLAGLLQRRLAPVDVTIEAALSGSRTLFAEALLLDGAVHDPSVAASMVDDFIARQAAYLPQFC